MKKTMLAMGLLALMAGPARAQSVATIKTATGEAAIENGNSKQAFQNALDAALRRAVEMGAGVELDAATVVEGGVLLQDKVFSHATGYVKSYEVESREEESGVAKVTLRDVVVGKSELERDLQAVKATIASQAHPRLYVLLREQALDPISTTGKEVKGGPVIQVQQGLMGQRIQTSLSRLGWKFVDPEVASGKVRVENVATSDLASLNARDFAVAGADYVVVGNVVVRPIVDSDAASAKMGVVSYPVQVNALINIKATDTGETIASISETVVLPKFGSKIERERFISADFASSSTKAVGVVAETVVEALTKQTLEFFRKRTMGTDSFHVMVNVADYDAYTALVELIGKVQNVKDSSDVKFEEGKGDIQVKLLGGSTKALAGSLSGKTVKGYQIKVTKVTPNLVEVKLAK